MRGLILAVLLIALSEFFLYFSHQNTVGTRKFIKYRRTVYITLSVFCLIFDYLYIKLEPTKLSCKDGYVCYCIKTEDI